MSKKEEFKSFIKDHPEILKYIKNKEMSWQDFYNIYDIYGTDNTAWDKYFNADNDKDIAEKTSSTAGIGELTNLVKNINMDNLQKHIKTAQKAISVIQDLTGKTTPHVASNVASKSPRPLNKFFDD